MSAVIKQAELNFRYMQEQDLDKVAQIEARAYEFPWSRAIFRDCLRVGYGCWVLESDAMIVGYGMMSVAVGESHILNLCVDPPLQGQGLGHTLLHFLLDVARQNKANCIFLEVRSSNDKAKLMYARNGFVEAGMRHDYYPAAAGREDAVIMAMSLV
ncbi:MAG: ribosomal protein S18-alanine N-acetyltransferase [Gammaproteobacteria bacterium]